MNQEDMMNRDAFMEEEREKRYQALSTEEKLLLNISDMGHCARFALDKKSGQKRVLIMLNEFGDMGQRELTHRIGIQPGSVSEILRKLEDAELIARTPDPEDRRGMRVMLTEEGKVLADHAAEKKKADTAVLFDMLGAEEKTELLSLLEKVNADWKEKFPMRPLPPEGRRERRPRDFGDMPCPDGPFGFDPMPGPDGPMNFEHMPCPDGRRDRRPRPERKPYPERERRRRPPFGPDEDEDLI